ncbi:protein SCARECROW-like [Carica papaya]|uniref:protein SCARECROW-like n=1 Tax=Carica papaya TaxID=3649 RepID=UPI000B8C82AA|nr:protein SCARECROW-like [Carica papaya]
MMKGAFEVVHGALDIHEPWDYSPSVNIGLIPPPPSTSIIFPKPLVLENLCFNNMEIRPDYLSDWVEHATKHLINDDLPADTPTDHHTCSFQAVTTMASQASIHSWSNRLDDQASNFRENGATAAAAASCTSLTTGNKGLNSLTGDEEGLSLLTHLLECAVAISVDNLSEAHRLLLELTQMASPYSPSCAERVVAYFAKAMSSRVINSWLGICAPLINHNSIQSAFQVFNNISPFIKFAHFTSNQAILEAFHCRDRVHIIDLDIIHGLQWPALFHILSTRIEGPPHLTMTAMGASMEVLLETGKQLSNFAKRLGLPFEFNPVDRKFGEIDDISVLKLKSDDTLAVHWLQHSLYDATGPEWKALRLLQKLAPRVITLVEQETSHGAGGSFLDRFVGCLHYYSTIFDSLGACLDFDDPSRHKVEHCLLYREINNILAIGGPARSGEDKLRNWRSELMASNCFVQVPMSSNSMAQAQLILNMYSPAYGYSLVQGDGSLKLGWKNTSLLTASSWTSHNSPDSIPYP